MRARTFANAAGAKLSVAYLATEIINLQISGVDSRNVFKIYKSKIRI